MFPSSAVTAFNAENHGVLRCVTALLCFPGAGAVELQEWFRRGTQTSPLTNLPLDSKAGARRGEAARRRSLRGRLEENESPLRRKIEKNS